MNPLILFSFLATADANTIGVFDARAVVVAYYRSPQWDAALRAHPESTRRETAHRQLSGEAPITNILEALQPVLRDLSAKDPRLSRIVPDAEKADVALTRVDVTPQLLNWLHADAETRKVVADLTPRRDVYREKFTQTRTVQGYVCRAGWAWFHTGGQLRSCYVDKETRFGEAIAPAGSWITLTSTGWPDGTSFRHDTRVHGCLCRGSRLGAEGVFTSFYPVSGRLKICWLAEDQIVDGVPCAASGTILDALTGGIPAAFHEDGRLKSCKLSSDYGKQKRGEKYQRTVP